MDHADDDGFERGGRPRQPDTGVGDWLPPGGTRVDTEREARPAAPLPPPPTWSAEHEGPGSPAGSVRPPDTTGTVNVTPERPSRSRGVGTVLLAALVGAVLGTAGTLTLARSTASTVTRPQVQAPVVEFEGDPDGRSAVVAVADAVIPSVVRIDRLVTAGGVLQEEGLGSGVIYRSDGYIVTNNHVVEGADRLQIKLASGESVDAEVAGTDALTDLAVLRIDRAGLPAINIRTDPPVRVGELAVAIGSPFGLDATVTAGVVSAVNRSIDVPLDDGFISIPNVVQTDAAINPGNSGGALVDGSGRLIGINSAILANAPIGGQAGNIGVGFAISAQEAVTVSDKLIEQGFVRHARLGIRAGDLTPSVAREYGIEVTEGVLVDQVDAGGPAEEAGLRAGDVIVAAAGEPLQSMDDLVARIRAREPGDALPLTVLRDGDRVQLEAVLGEWSR